MATNPNGPSLNDLMYGSYNAAGYVNVTTLIPFIPIPVQDITWTSETVSLNLPGFTYSIDVLDNSITSENETLYYQQSNSFSLGLSDSTVTSEALNFLTSPIFLGVSDSTVTSEFVDRLRAGARDLALSDSTVTSESINPVKN